MHRPKSDSFGSLLSRRRQEWALNLEQLADGLCTASEIARMEKGMRTPDKALRDRLLTRVGISPDTHESFLFGDDFVPWKLRQQILTAVTKREIAYARQLLTQYRERYIRPRTGAEAVYERLERQFCLSMEGQLKRYENVAREKLAALFEEALSLTVPRPEEPVRGRALSVHEINLFLEYIRYCCLANKAARFLEILEYIEQSHLDDLSRARVYPKAICYFYTYGFGISGCEANTLDFYDCGQALRLCNAGIRLLRENGRLYHLWELLILRRVLLQSMAASLSAQGETNKANALRLMQKENEDWLHALDLTCAECGVSRETEDFCYLYVEKEVYCIGDVIRIRRHMIGMTKSQLCDGICSEKTLSRLERNLARTHWTIVRELFARLKLAPEYCRTELVTDSLEAIACMDELRKCIQNWECEKAELLIRRITKVFVISGLA